VNLDSTGANNYSCGYRTAATTGSYVFIFKHSSTNALVWSKDISGLNSGDYLIFPELRAVVADPSGHAIAAGVAAGKTNASYLGQIVSLASSNGALRWNLSYDRVYAFYSLYTHTDGYVYAGGVMKTYVTDPAGTSVVGGIVLKIDPSNGSVVNHFTIEYTGTGSVNVDKISAGTNSNELCIHVTHNPALGTANSRVLFIPTSLQFMAFTHSGLVIDWGNYTITTATSRLTTVRTTFITSALTPASTATTQTRSFYGSPTYANTIWQGAIATSIY
jgi:hypothetical protein